MDIYTIGHSNYELTRLVDMLKHYNINCIVDIRATPYSKYNIQYNKENIKHTLINLGFTYIYMAKEFGAKRETKTSYNSYGYADFEKVINEIDFKNGVKRLKLGIKKGYKIALLGAMQEPLRCHRSILVGKALTEEGFHVKHILHDYSLASQLDIEESLLDKYFKGGKQLTLDTFENSISREDMLLECYRLANKEIGYRIENLN